jgi:hypothetical protein
VIFLIAFLAAGYFWRRAKRRLGTQPEEISQYGYGRYMSQPMQTLASELGATEKPVEVASTREICELPAR